MTQAHAMTHTEDLRTRYGTALTDALDKAAAAVASGDFRQAGTEAGLLREHGEHVYTAVVRDALAAGLDWWAVGVLLSMHPQAAYEQYRGAMEGLKSPAEQHPENAVVLTAGVAAEHDWDDAYGIDLDDLGADHSLYHDPIVLRLREAAALLREDIWIAVNLPGEYEGQGEAEEGAVAVHWTTVTVADAELVWLRETLRLNADDNLDDDGEDDPGPLD